LKVSPRWFWPILVFLTTQLIFLHTLNPAFQNDDSAETITAGATLGLQHPPSYALTALVGRVQWLLPLGGFEFRANWGSSLWASFDSALLTFLIIWLVKNLFFFNTVFSNPWAATFCGIWGGFSLAMAPAYWHNALNAKGEVYLLSVFFQLLILSYMVIGESGKNVIAARVLGLPLFLIGLGLSNHWETFVIFIPAIFIFFLLIRPRRLAGWVQGISFLILGVSPLIFLPLRAHLNPALNFGEPDKLNYFWADLFRTYYSYREVSLWGMLVSLLKSCISLNQFLTFFHQLIKNKSETLFFNLGQDIGWFSFGLAVLGISGWLRLAEKKILFFLLLSWFLLWGSLFSYYDTIQSLGSPLWMIKFFLSSDWLLFLLASIGLFFLLSKINRLEKKAGFIAVALITGYLTINMNNGFRSMDQKDQLILYDYGQNLLKSLPAHSLFFAESDEDYFSIYYLQQVEHRRADVTMIPTFTLFEPWGTQKVERENSNLGLTASSISFPDHFARIIYATSELVVKNKKQRPVAFSYFNGAFHRYYLDRVKNIKIRSSGLVWLLDSPMTRDIVCLTPKQLRIRNLQAYQHQWNGCWEGIREIYNQTGLNL
jgi:hypothetical protein